MAADTDDVTGSAHDALRRIKTQGDRATDEAAWSAGHALLGKEYDDALERGLAKYRPTLANDASAAEILAEASRITRAR